MTDITVETELVERAFAEISRGAIRGFVQPFIARAVYVELRQCVAIPLPDVVAAIEAALATLQARIAEAEGRGRLAGMEEAKRICEQQALDFLSPEYATPQPIGSITERFACKECAEAIGAALVKARGGQAMKLEHGNCYVNGRGDPIGPMDERTPGHFLDQHGTGYYPDGLQWGHVEGSTGNIVAATKFLAPKERHDV